MARARLTIVMMIFVLGALAAQASAAQTVLFDNGHGERFEVYNSGPLQLSRFAEMVRETGADVVVLEKPISDATLKGASGLVISGAFAALKPEEIDAVMRFIQGGGKLAVMLHIAPPLTPLLDRLMITYTNGVIQEKENVIGDQPLNFKVSRFGNHPVLQGVRDISLYGVWGLMNLDDTTRIVAATSPNAWVDLKHDKKQTKEETASFGVAVAGESGKGGFLVFGDDAIFQNKFLDQNKALAANLARWLK